MPNTRDKDDKQHNEDCIDTSSGAAAESGDVGRVLSKAVTDITGVGTGLLGGLAGALDGLVGGLAGEKAPTRRTKIHPWDLPRETRSDHSPDEARNKPDEYDEDYDRIH